MRDTRGTPGRLIIKNHQPRLKLTDLLRRRKTTLRAFSNELGISTLGMLTIWCERMGVTPPTQEQFNESFPPTLKVNSPSEGVIVLEAPPVIDEISGDSIDPDAHVEAPGVSVVIDAHVQPMDGTQKKTRKRKEGSPT